MGIDPVHVVLAGQGSDRLDGTGSLGSEMRGSRVDLFHLLILEHHHLEAQIAARDEQRDAGDTDGGELLWSA